MSDNTIYITSPNEFLRPYIEQETGKTEPAFSVMVSSTYIYSPDRDAIINEDGPIDKNSPWAQYENEFLKAHPDGIILRAAPIVGTGMTGKIRRLAEEIYKARFFQKTEYRRAEGVFSISATAKTPHSTTLRKHSPTEWKTNAYPLSARALNR